MVQNIIRRVEVVLAAWLPFFAMWFLVTLSASREPFRVVLLASLVSMGTAGLVGIPIWYACKRWPLPADFRFSFYLLHVSLAVLYGTAWTAVTAGLQLLRGSLTLKQITLAAVGRQVLLGGWCYAIFAGISYAGHRCSRGVNTPQRRSCVFVEVLVEATSIGNRLSR